MEALTNYYYQAQDYFTQNPWVFLIVLVLLFWFFVKPRLSRGMSEGFTGGQSLQGGNSHVAQDNYATTH